MLLSKIVHLYKNKAIHDIKSGMQKKNKTQQKNKQTKLKTVPVCLNLHRYHLKLQIGELS